MKESIIDFVRPIFLDRPTDLSLVRPVFLDRPTSQKRGRHAVARRGGASALAQRQAHSEYLETSTEVLLKIGSQGFARFGGDAE